MLEYVQLFKTLLSPLSYYTFDPRPTKISFLSWTYPRAETPLLMSDDTKNRTLYRLVPSPTASLSSSGPTAVEWSSPSSESI